MSHRSFSSIFDYFFNDFPILGVWQVPGFVFWVADLYFLDFGLIPFGFWTYILGFELIILVSGAIFLVLDLLF